MELLDKVIVNPNICGVELAFNGELLASSIPDWQQFYNSLMIATDFSKTHIGLGSVSFGEESQQTNAGVSYKQSIVIRFPACDENRSQRLELLQRVKFLKLKLTNGRDIVIGRNDFKQNARPRIKTETNIKTAEAKFETVSIFSSGFVSNLESFALPTFIPLTLY